jgi:predicted transcriptional regulator
MIISGFLIPSTFCQIGARRKQVLFFSLIYDVFECIVLEYQIRGMFMKATTIRIHDDMLGRIDGLAKELSRSRSWVITQAIDRFLEYEEWFVQEVKEGLAEAARGELATQDEVVARFRKWGADAS